MKCSHSCWSAAGGSGNPFKKDLLQKYFKRCGNGLIVGRNCVFRHPTKISIGDNVTIDDISLIDAGNG
jgi:hypothetical protein